MTLTSVGCQSGGRRVAGLGVGRACWDGAVTPKAAALVAVVVLGVTACGGGTTDEPAPEPTPSATTPEPEPEPEPTAVSIDGTPAPEALSRFRCEPRDSGWVASGFVSNDTDNAASFQVTVSVGPGDGEDTAGVTRRLESVEAGGSVEFELEKIPAAGEQCRVQVLRLP